MKRGEVMINLTMSFRKISYSKEQLLMLWRDQSQLDTMEEAVSWVIMIWIIKKWVTRFKMVNILQSKKSLILIKVSLLILKIRSMKSKPKEMKKKKIK